MQRVKSEAKASIIREDRRSVEGMHEGFSYDDKDGKSIKSRTILGC